jgi:hypothetical protein
MQSFPANMVFDKSAKLICDNGNFPLAAMRPYEYSPSQGSGRSSGVEHNLAKVRVGRSNRLARSN